MALWTKKWWLAITMSVGLLTLLSGGIVYFYELVQLQQSYIPVIIIMIGAGILLLIAATLVIAYFKQQKNPAEEERLWL